MNQSLKHNPLLQVPKHILYRRPLHPELFAIKDRRVIRHGDYEAECWLMENGHAVRFSIDSASLMEVCVEGGDHLPETGMVQILPCFGERDHEQDPIGGVGYMTSLQTENLSENLYNSTLEELIQFAEETGAMYQSWHTAAGKTLFVLDVQRYRREFHVQAYHLRPDGGSVLRTQSVFEIVR